MKYYYVYIVLLIVFLASASVVFAKGPHGIYAFGWGDNFQDTPALSVDDIAGMTAYFGWKDLEPEDGKYDFSSIEALLVKAKEENKKINIGIYPGANTPSWVYGYGVKKFSWYVRYREDRRRFSHRDGEQKVSPLPWDSRYLYLWKRFVSHLADTYRGNDSVGYVSLTGPVVDTLTTGLIIKKSEDWRRFVGRGYSIDVLYRSWVDIIDFYHKVFRGRKPLVLGLAPERPGTRDVTLSKKIFKYIVRKNYKDIQFLCVFLNDTWFLRGGGAIGIRTLLKDARKKGFSFGYQMAAPARTSSRWRQDFRVVKSLRRALEIGLDDGASWLEVWHSDLFTKSRSGKYVRYPGHVGDIRYANSVMKKKGG
ncbi:beta-galactosidase [Geothermobacter hydrogeniphilus]|uniref:beta-galactosidase n=1 Tax=Geothermobacter hydrogeniphilus TaxID=1969733 RepID=UPI0011AEE009|nr:beta-galactosidase [Geothermobacter hydrogeniphilus]